MFLRHLDFIFVPFRQLRSKWVKAKSLKGNVKMDVNRMKSVGQRAKGAAGKAKGYAGQAQKEADAAQQQVAGAQGKIQGHAPGGQAAAPQEAAQVNPPQIVSKGFIFKKHFCSQCEQQLDKSWDHCPYCAQAAAAGAQAAAGPGPKTQAFMVDAAGTSGHMQLLGWVIPLSGPQKGELYTLSPVSSVGTDPACNVFLADQFMSSHHAEIKAEGGRWILRDLGSTNGTYVNDQRIDQRELVDNDVVKFGQSPAKFKSL